MDHVEGWTGDSRFVIQTEMAEVVVVVVVVVSRVFNLEGCLHVIPLLFFNALGVVVGGPPPPWRAVRSLGPASRRTRIRRLQSRYVWIRAVYGHRISMNRFAMRDRMDGMDGMDGTGVCGLMTDSSRGSPLGPSSGHEHATTNTNTIPDKDVDLTTILCRPILS